MEILDEPEDIYDYEDAVNVDRLEGNVAFNNVTHQYAVDDDEALKNMSSHAPKGTTIGLLGATGAGKTSLTQLIARFYEPNSGEIMNDDR
ncbi:ATP-binding cassette domain-containing protein, partial [Staphylococcus sp. SIMBA_130]